MKTNTTEIVLVVDRSGSMSTIKNDIEGGFKTFIDAQKKLPGEAYVTFYQFDTLFETVFSKKPIAEVDGITIEPRGGTALLDATGRAINEVGARLANTPEHERPENVIFVVLTDGEENSSREFSAEKVKEMVQHQQEKYSWKFIFLGANLDAVTTGAQYGFTAGTSLTFATNGNAICSAVNTLNAATSYYRAKGTRCVSDYSISDADRLAAITES